ncbi:MULTISPECIES: DUF7500 family protein [Halorussus]|uniref:DUF7500 family protein n=1 Tax=Halorussus TaxID=1070314 RepID=UPI00209CB121|nr:hypothetical protein [Halorussus vallis]USZ76589.1 hypothetical protein NGM07_04490 [Halorussus vallis]
MCPTPDDGRDPDDRRPLSPDDLDIENEENVVPLDEGRYVIGTDDRPTVSPEALGGGSGAAESAGSATNEGGAGGGGSSDGSPGGDAGAPGSNGADAHAAVDSASVKRWLEDDLDSVSARYGFHVTAKAEDSIAHQQLFSDDVTTVFDGLLRWYAQQLTTETPVEDVLGILLTESDVRVRYTLSCLRAILEAYDLGPDDTIADLYDAVQDDRGMVFPPEDV